MILRFLFTLLELTALLAFSFLILVYCALSYIEPQRAQSGQID